LVIIIPYWVWVACVCAATQYILGHVVAAHETDAEAFGCRVLEGRARHFVVDIGQLFGIIEGQSTGTAVRRQFEEIAHGHVVLLSQIFFSRRGAMKHPADVIVAVLLFVLTTTTMMNLMTPPRSLLHLTSLHVASFIALIAYLHYSVEYNEDDSLRRTVIRFVDWIITTPLMRMQMYTLENTSSDLVLNRMFLSTQTFMLLSLWAEITPWVEAKLILGVLSIMVANYSIVIIESPVPRGIDRATRYIMVAYTVVYLSMLGGERVRYMREIVFAFMDATIKWVFVTWLILHHRQAVG
jgi:hypothetical protein